MIFKRNIQINEFFESSVKMGLNPFTLKFAGNLEKEFLADYYKSSILICRFALILGIILYSLFAFLDIILIPEIKNQAFVIRFLFVIPLLIIIFSLSFQKQFKNWWQAAAISSVLIAGMGIIAIIWISPYNGKVFYYVGIILVLIYNYLITRIRFVWATITGFGLIIFCLLSITAYQNVPKDFLINNIFFLISANILGMFGSYILEYFSRRNFYLKYQLSLKNVELDDLNKSLDEKVHVRTIDLKESEELFRTIIEQAGDAMYLSDFDGNILEVNSRAIEEMGYNLDEFLKLNVTNLDREYVDPKKAREF